MSHLRSFEGAHITSKKILLQVRHNYTGLMTTCNEYLQAFEGKDFRKIVVILKGKEDERVKWRIPADEVVFLGLTDRQLRFPYLRPVVELSRFSRSRAADVILAHRYKPALLMALVSLFYRPEAMFVVVHKNYQFNTLARRLVGRHLLAPRCKFIGVSESVRQSIVDNQIVKKGENALALPNCIDFERVRREALSREAARQRLSLREDDFVIGSVGRLSPVKDPVTLLRAFACARRGIPCGKLVIVGEGRLETELKAETTRLQLDESVVFAGHIQDAFRVMPAFDVFALTSVSEALCRVLLEAMACSLPVVATRTGGNPEVIGETVELYPCGNIEAIADAFIAHASMPKEQLDERGRMLRERVEQLFSAKVFAFRLQKFVSSCLS